MSDQCFVRVTEERDVATKAVVESDAKRDELLDECAELKARLSELLQQIETKGNDVDAI